MKIVILIIGALMLLLGLLWLGQGTGIIAWPANNFMIDQRPWAIRGAILALAGIVLLWYGRRR